MPKSVFHFLLLTMFLAVSTSAVAAEPASGKTIDFNRDIKPILSNACFKCHGPDKNERKGGANGLRLDTSAGAVEDQGDHAAIVPGKPDDSEAIVRIKSTDPEEI